MMKTREYSKKPYIDDENGESDEIYTVEEFKSMNMHFDWGSAYWMKDNLISTDDFFTTPQEDATHVVWHNK